jgi:hypothetical protein
MVVHKITRKYMKVHECAEVVHEIPSNLRKYMKSTWKYTKVHESTRKCRNSSEQFFLKSETSKFLLKLVPQVTWSLRNSKPKIFFPNFHFLNFPTTFWKNSFSKMTCHLIEIAQKWIWPFILVLSRAFQRCAIYWPRSKFKVIGGNP